MAIEYASAIHCTDPTCQKCSARFRWLRRKEWHVSKTTTRKNTERK
jgi:hypothetical protein